MDNILKAIGKGISNLQTELNWGGVFPNVKAQQETDRYYDQQQKEIGKAYPNAVEERYRPDFKPPPTPPPPSIFEAIGSKIGDVKDALFGKVVSPVPEAEANTTRVMFPTSTPSPTSVPTTTPTPKRTGLPEGVTSSQGIIPPPPPDEYSRIVDQIWGDSADKAKVVMWTENGGFRPDAINKNNNGTRDIGLFQVNTGTFDGFLKRKPRLMEQYGMRSYDDLFDPVKNAQMAKLIYDEQGWGAWYGPGNKGFTIR